MDITITITDTQYKGLQYVAVDPVEWAENAVLSRANTAVDDIVKVYTSKALENGVAIPSTKEEIVTDAYARGWVETWEQVSSATLPTSE